jgi:hypothetical protein
VDRCVASFPAHRVPVSIHPEGGCNKEGYILNDALGNDVYRSVAHAQRRTKSFIHIMLRTFNSYKAGICGTEDCQGWAATNMYIYRKRTGIDFPTTTAKPTVDIYWFSNPKNVKKQSISISLSKLKPFLIGC